MSKINPIKVPSNGRNSNGNGTQFNDSSPSGSPSENGFGKNYSNGNETEEL